MNVTQGFLNLGHSNWAINSLLNWLLSKMFHLFSIPCSLHLLYSTGRRNGNPQYKDWEVEKFWDKIFLKGCKWSSLNAPGAETAVSHPMLGDSLFIIF